AAGDEDSLPRDRSVGEETSMCGDRRDAEARPLGEARVRRKRDGQTRRHDGVLGGGAPRTLPLDDVEPDSLAEPSGRHAGADLVDDAGAILVRDHARRRHRPRAYARLDVRGIETGDGDADTDLPGPRLGDGQLTDRQNIRGSAGPLVPGGADDREPATPYRTSSLRNLAISSAA